jgi:transcriptional regulator with XRE-family HTH domain
MAKAREKHPVQLEFGKRIREARRARGWTQEVLGEKVDLDRTYIGGIERGERNIGLCNINNLALALGSTAVGFIPCRKGQRRK